MSDIIHYIPQIKEIETPFYFYDTDLLKQTLDEIHNTGISRGYKIHYALKANVHPDILSFIKDSGMGADCVSFGEIKRALDAGFPPQEIVFAGVGKTDKEIQQAIHSRIFCFNCESSQEISIINHFANAMNTPCNIALRINPDIQTDTHRYISTGSEENKFGISFQEVRHIIDTIHTYSHIHLIGIHVHIGSQIQNMENFVNLCKKINEIQSFFQEKKIKLALINVGGGLGVDYSFQERIPDFKSYFDVFQKHLNLFPHQELHFELGRSIVAQCGTLVSRILYTKMGAKKHFLILDAGMNELIRPALYQAKHLIENITSKSERSTCYDVVGPICESSDTFRENILLPESMRGDIMVIRSAGAYGEVMRSHYNIRQQNASIMSYKLIPLRIKNAKNEYFI